MVIRNKQGRESVCVMLSPATVVLESVSVTLSPAIVVLGLAAAVLPPHGHARQRGEEVAVEEMHAGGAAALLPPPRVTLLRGGVVRWRGSVGVVRSVGLAKALGPRLNNGKYGDRVPVAARVVVTSRGEAAKGGMY